MTTRASAIWSKAVMPPLCVPYKGHGATLAVRRHLATDALLSELKPAQRRRLRRKWKR